MFSPDDLIGRVLGGQYRIETLLGRGGFGAVFRARDVHLDRPVAVKVLTQSAAGLARRFRREARVQARFRHPAIVRLLQFGEEGGLHFMVQEFVDGRTLRAAVEQEGPLDPGRVARIFAELLDALDEAHAEGIVHRDIKPENIMLVAGRRGEEPRLLDFGIAKIFEESEELQALTASGMVIGTPAWLAPEQATRQPITPAADVYSLGCVMHYALTGQRPFQGTAVQVLLDHVNTPPPPLPSAVPAALAAVVQTAMGKHPADRYPSALAMKDALEAVHPPPPTWRTAPPTMRTDPSWRPPAGPPDASPSGATPVAISNISPAPEATARRWWPLAVALVLLGGAGALGVILAADGDDPPAVVAADARVSPPDAGQAVDAAPAAPADAAGVAAEPDAGVSDAAVDAAPDRPVPSAGAVARRYRKQLQRQLDRCDCSGAERTVDRLRRVGADARETWSSYCARASGGALSRCAKVLDRQLTRHMATCPCHDDAVKAIAVRLEDEFGVPRLRAWKKRCATPLPGSCLAPK